MAAAIESLLDDPAAARELGRNARARALQRFGAARQVDAWDQLYRRVGTLVRPIPYTHVHGSANKPH